MKIGFITIGQSPRDDVLSDLPDALREVEIVQTGALDGFTFSQIATMYPTQNDTVYVSRLRDGSEVKVAKEKLIPILEERVERLRNDVDALVILCSGKMTLNNSDRVTFPSELLHRKVESIAKRTSKLGVIIPENSQSQAARAGWQYLSTDPIPVAKFSPYSEPIDHLTICSRALINQDIIVMDCIGYSKRHEDVVREVTGKQTLGARSTIFQFLENQIRSSAGPKIVPSL